MYPPSPPLLPDPMGRPLPNLDLDLKIRFAKSVLWPLRKMVGKIYPPAMDPDRITVAESIAGFSDIDDYL